MTHHSILKNIAKRIHLNNDETVYFISQVSYKEVAKKQLLLKEGQHCNHLYYVQSGILRAYCTDKDGKEATIMFAISDWWITDMYCFLNARPAMMFIETIEDSCIFEMEKQAMDKLFTQVPKFERFFRILMQNAYTREQLRVIENLSLPAEERYDSFVKKYPQVVAQVTQKQIASYLGITPEFLSVIRKNKTQKNIS